ncbi:hypothetical protein PRIC1_006595 [Phytophthora ramorum]|uniref:uncharacterized protein n=1 Tax=Phytophthora ramorum TaxID=164328 RepID=UPI00309DE266|nr:hypothetical protein KRP23_12894 [Phytophthora ramorum]
MKLSFFLVLLLVAFIDFSNSLANAESAVKENGSFRPVLSAHRGLQGSQTRSGEATDIDSEDEERGLNVPGFSKLKSLFQKSGGLTNNAGALQKNSEVVKNLKTLKSQPKILNTLKSMQKNPKVVEALQKAPVTEANVKKLQTAMTKGNKKGFEEPPALAYLYFGLIFLGVAGFVALLAQIQ